MPEEGSGKRDEPRIVNYDAIAPTYDRRYQLEREYSGVESCLSTFIGGSDATLEVGCGTGHWLTFLSKQVRVVVGIDPSAKMLEQARLKARDAWLTRGWAEVLPFASRSFDRIFCINAFHHFSDKANFVNEAQRVLVPKGGLLIMGLDPHTGKDSWWIYDYFAGPRAVVPLRVAHLPAALDMDLESWFECYLADCEARGVTRRTLAWYRDRGRRIVEFFLSIDLNKPDDVSRSSVSKLMAHVRTLERRGKPLEPQTILGYWQVGKGFFTFLRAEGAFLPPNPFDEFGKPRVREKATWAPSIDECLAILRIPDRRTARGLRDLAILYLLVDTGLRVSALCTIRVRDVDIPQRRVQVLEKGEHLRFLPIGVQSLRWLRRYLGASRLSLDDHLFPGRAGRPISRKRIDEIVKSCAEGAGVRRGRVSAHDFRRAFAREFLRNGGDMESLRQLLGHSSYAMVKRYAELASDVVAEQHRKASPGDRLCL